MKIYVLDEILQYENREKIIDDMFDDINNIISKSNYTFSHLEVDGDTVYEDFYNHLLHNIENIKEIKVVTKNFKEFAKDVLKTTRDYLENSIKEIKVLSNIFYKSPNKKSWQKLGNLIESIRWIIDTFTLIDKSAELENIVTSYETWNLYVSDIYSLQELLKEFEHAIESEDLVSIGDILSYEIAPVFNNMKEKLDILVNREVASSDSN